MNKDKPLVDQIADVHGRTTMHYEYKDKFRDPLVMAAWIESKKAEWQREAIEATIEKAYPFSEVGYTREQLYKTFNLTSPKEPQNDN